MSSLMVMLRGVLVLGLIAATDATAAETSTQMYPLVTQCDALVAHRARRFDGLD